MISVNPDTVRFIIEKARAFQILEADSTQEESASTADDWDTENFANHVDDPSHDGDDPSRDEMVSTIEDLEPDQQICLVALMWLGRGDFSIEEWSSALVNARREHNAQTADYLIGTPLVANYLSEGLIEHGYDLE